MDIGQPLAGYQPEPEMKRHCRRIAGVFRNSLADIKIGFLDHVRRIDTAGEPAVEPQADHLAAAGRDSRRRAADQRPDSSPAKRGSGGGLHCCRPLDHRPSLGSLTRYPGSTDRCPQAPDFFEAISKARPRTTLRSWLRNPIFRSIRSNESSTNHRDVNLDLKCTLALVHCNSIVALSQHFETILFGSLLGGYNSRKSRQGTDTPQAKRLSGHVEYVR